ncbi:hypothetical protein OPQ81_009389 [Rhizoctonia solani]|nr:hypothetical protein OPQ81_009389 [Rhizoctonia solani]
MPAATPARLVSTLQLLAWFSLFIVTIYHWIRAAGRGLIPRRQMSADSVQAPSSKSALRPHAPKHITLPQESTGSESSRTK